MQIFTEILDCLNPTRYCNTQFFGVIGLKFQKVTADVKFNEKQTTEQKKPHRNKR